MTEASKILLVNNFVQAESIVRSVKATKSALATVFSNMVYFGWTPSKELIETLSSYSTKDLEKFWSNAEPVFKAVTGVDRNMDKFVVYKNFPAEVLEKSEAEYWFCQILMYVGFPVELFAEPEKERPALADKKDLKILNLATADTFASIFNNLKNAKNRWNDEQLAHAIYINSLLTDETIELSSFGFKENGISIIKSCIETNRKFEIKDATDILRLAAALSDQDISLRTNVRFKKFKRSERKLLLSLLEESKNLAADASMRQSVWKKFMYQLHPGDYNFANVQKVYGELCHGELKSFNAVVEKHITDGNEKALTMLEGRQGELLRRFHKLYEVFGEKAVDKTVALMGDFNTLQLLKLKKYVQSINNRTTLIYAPNGNWSHARFVPKESKALTEIVKKAVVTEEQVVTKKVKQPKTKPVVEQKVEKADEFMIEQAVQSLVDKFSGKLAANEIMSKMTEIQAQVKPAVQAKLRKAPAPIVPTAKVELSAYAIETIVKAIDEEIAKRMDVHFPEGVALDEKTKYIKLQNNDQKLAANYGRGTVFDMPDNIKFIRTASYWKMSNSGNVFFDNSWNFFKEDWTATGACCWNAHMNGDAAVFSGDPVISKEVQGRGCQMIDLYIDKLIEKGVRYAVWSLLSYNSIKFDDAEDVFATLQMGENPESGKLYEPSRAQMAFEVKGQNLTKYVAYIDLVERKVIYMDANLPASIRSANENTGMLSQKMPAFVEYLDTLPSVFDLFESTKVGSTPILHDDVDVKIAAGKAYVFKPKNVENSYEAIEINKLLQ